MGKTYDGRFAIDRKGLSKVLEKKGYSWIIYELVSNCFDEEVKNVDILLTQVGPKKICLTISDNSPTGFRDLTHAWTMYAESYKKDASQRGRFNLGEKLVIAMADQATIHTTTGTVTFSGEQRTVDERARRQFGTSVEVYLKCTEAQYYELKQAVPALIPPPGVRVTYNEGLGPKTMPTRVAVARFECTLPTEIPGEDGVLRPTQRKTMVELYEPSPGETAHIYEMGIPVVETGDRYHINIMQRVPLNPERDNVRPAYLKAVRAIVLENSHDKLSLDEFSKPWVSQAVTDGRVGAKALSAYLDAKYGADRVVHDPSSAESTGYAQAAGYQVVAGRSESKETWERIRENNLIPSASKLFPAQVDPISKYIPPSEWTRGMHKIVTYSEAVAVRLLKKKVSVLICNEPTSNIRACYGSSQLTYNYGRLGAGWFENGITPGVNSLLIHELGHDFSGNHLSTDYYRALTDLGAGLVSLALNEPELFK